MITDVKIKKWFQGKKEREKYSVASIFGVDYAHLKLPAGDDFFITAQGLSLLGNLNPADFRAESAWFKNNSVRLPGSGCAYKVRTKKVNGRNRDVVIKWNRMGEDIPGASDYEELLFAEFNSPFEEFALVKELREALRKSNLNITLQKPLAIYVPSEKVESWQTGRAKHKMKTIIDSHTEIGLDMNRLYMLIFEWLEGQDAAWAYTQGLLGEDEARKLAQDAAAKFQQIGFVVRDNKPNHIILNPVESRGRLPEDRNQLNFGYIDYELLERTAQQQNQRKTSQRQDYHRRQKDRFATDLPNKFHPHLQPVNIFGVDYIFGQVTSTKGRLWVVGKDPYLFDYFQPERWEGTKRTKVSMFSESYYTVTKDTIHIVWEASKVGLSPDMDPFLEDEKRILDYGYNSPFEEISLAIELSQRGVATIYPRAIYMLGSKSEISERFFDPSRYDSHQGLVGPDGIPLLVKNREYIIIWGYWNGPDEKLAEKDGDFYEGINALYAYREGVISHQEYMALLHRVKERLHAIGVEDLNLSGKHLLISVNSAGEVIRGQQGTPDSRICNFEFLKKMK